MSDNKNEFNIDDLVSNALGNIEQQTEDIKQKNDDADPYSIENGFEFGESSEKVDEMDLKSSSGKYEKREWGDISTVDYGEKPIEGGLSLNELRVNPIKNKKNENPRRKKKKGGFAKAVIWTLVIIFLSLGIAVGGLAVMIEVMGFNFNVSEVWITIPQGASTKQIAEILKEKDVINSALLFRVYSKVTGADGQYNYGDYELNVAGYDMIITELKKPGIQAPEVTVTIPERATVDDICKLLVENDVCSEKDFKEAMRDGTYDYDFVADIPTDKVYYRFEGYLFPETYNFFIKTDDVDGVQNAERAIDKMLYETDKHITDEMKTVATEKGYTVHEMLTMASILELEASGSPDEMKNVAQVFYNRLAWEDQPKLLGSTPTSKYPYGNGRYDTNIYEGLPPGPMCCPSEDAIKAAFYPNTDITATYFVTDKDMNFYYRDTLAEHNAIIAQLKNKGIWEY